jgi:hypothetical protein
MEIAVKDLKSNPFRNLDSYPVQRAKIDALKTSISETTFWDNLLVRKSPKGGKFEIAYGHNRLEALRELNITKIDVPLPLTEKAIRSREQNARGVAEKRNELSAALDGACGKETRAPMQVRIGPLAPEPKRLEPPKQNGHGEQPKISKEAKAFARNALNAMFAMMNEEGGTE